MINQSEVKETNNIRAIDVFEATINYQKLIREYKSLVKLALVSGLMIGSLVTGTIMMVLK